MSRSLLEVRRAYPQAVAEYRLAMPRAGGHAMQLGYWAIVSRDRDATKTLGRGATEMEAWDVAARAGRFENFLATLDQQANATHSAT